MINSMDNFKMAISLLGKKLEMRNNGLCQNNNNNTTQQPKMELQKINERCIIFANLSVKGLIAKKIFTSHWEFKFLVPIYCLCCTKLSKTGKKSVIHQK